MFVCRHWGDSFLTGITHPHHLPACPACLWGLPNPPRTPSVMAAVPQPRAQAARQAAPPQPRQKAGGVGTPKETHHHAQHSWTSTTQRHFTTMCPEGAPVTGAQTRAPLEPSSHWAQAYQLKHKTTPSCTITEGRGRTRRSEAPPLVGGSPEDPTHRTRAPTPCPQPRYMNRNDSVTFSLLFDQEHPIHESKLVGRGLRDSLMAVT